MNTKVAIESALNKVEPYLTEETKKVLQVKTEQLTTVKDGKVIGKVRYIGKIFLATELEPYGYETFGKILNDVVKNYNATGALAPVIELSMQDSLNSVALLSYLEFSPSDAILMESHSWNIREGHFPENYNPSEDDLNKLMKN